MSLDHSNGSSRTGGTGADGSGAVTAARERGLCTFWLSDRQFGLDVGLVGEIVTVENALPVPLAPAAVRGVFNLRGTPIALLDIGQVLGLDLGKEDELRKTALVVRNEGVVVAFLIDRMETVVPP